jgi:hypothetical protein
MKKLSLIIGLIVAMNVCGSGTPIIEDDRDLRGGPPGWQNHITDEQIKALVDPPNFERNINHEVQPLPLDLKGMVILEAMKSAYSEENANQL